MIANCRNGLIFAFRDAAVVVFFFDRDRLIVDREMQGPNMFSIFLPKNINFGEKKSHPTI